MNLERARQLLSPKIKDHLNIYPNLYDNYQLIHYNIVKNISTMTKDLIKPYKEAAFYFPIHQNSSTDLKNIKKTLSHKILNKKLPLFNLQSYAPTSKTKRVVNFRNKIQRKLNFKSQKCLNKEKPLKLKKKYNLLLRNISQKNNFTTSFKNLNSNKIFDDIFKENNEMYTSLCTENNSNKYNIIHNRYNINESVYHKKLEKNNHGKAFKQLSYFKLSNNDIGFNETRMKKILSNTFRDCTTEKLKNKTYSQKSFSNSENKKRKFKNVFTQTKKLYTEKKFIILKKSLRKQNDFNYHLLNNITKENVSGKDNLKIELAKLNSYNFKSRSRY